MAQKSTESAKSRKEHSTDSTEAQRREVGGKQKSHDSPVSYSCSIVWQAQAGTARATRPVRPTAKA